MAYLRGVNLAGPDFYHGRGELNKDYSYNSEASFAYFAGKGLTLIRQPFLWERIQPELRGSFDSLHLGLLKQAVGWAGRHGCQVVLDIHNYAAYPIDETSYRIDNEYDGAVKVTTADFCDLWVRLSDVFKDEPAVLAYGLMNEPHDMGTASWKDISQAALTAIRNNGDNKLIMVPGDHWSSASQWWEYNGPTGWITDPADNFFYEAHTYFDNDRTGTYRHSYEWELEAEPNLLEIGPARLKPFVDWCTANGVRGFLGEFGVPNNDPRWNIVLDNFLTSLDAAGFDATYWAAGETWGNYPLSAQPTDNFTTDAAMMPVLERHLGTGDA